MVLACIVLLAGCATQPNQPIPLPPTIPLPSEPPMPAPASVMKRQSVRAFAAASATFTSPDNSASTNYATVRHFAVTNELGAKSLGVRITFPNWPTNTAYSILASTNLVDWRNIILSRGDAGATLEVIDQEHVEFYRIAPAWFSSR
jgi:hypothetical protein